MRRKMFPLIIASTPLLLGLPLVTAPAGAETIIADHSAVPQFELIPSQVIEQIRAGYKIYYAHTSHGSQIGTGLDMLVAENALYALPTIHHPGGDLGHNGDTSWVLPTRSWLNAHPDYNVAMWSWCGGVSYNTEEGINIYLNAVSQLENDYPNVTFIYMTGHLDGDGPSDNLYIRNNQIRAYCTANGKVLFDFADIESYDPDGNYYPYENDDCFWCYDWCSSHSCPSCDGCAHSHCFNCYLKGKAFWWMMARVSGWNSGAPVCGDIDGSGSEPNIADLLYLVEYMFNYGPAPPIMDMSDVNGSGLLDISDLLYMVEYIFGSGPKPTCGQ